MTALLISLSSSSASAHEFCSDRPLRLQCTSVSRTFVEHVDRKEALQDLNRMLAGDLNGDGRADLVLSARARGLFALLADETGAYAGEPRPISSEELLLGTLGDMDGNGTLDVVAHAYPDDDAEVVVFANDGLGNFQAVLSPILPNMDHVSVIVANDINGDQQKDLVVLGAQFREGLAIAHGSVELYTADGNAFVLGGRLSPEITNSIALGDVDADGSVDIVLETSRDDDFAQNPQSTLSLYRNAGPAQFSLAGQVKVPLLSFAGANSPMRLRDLDQNGTLDILSVPRTSEDVVFVSNLGRGSFGAVERISVGGGVPYLYEVEALDLDLDGDLDLLARAGRWASLVMRSSDERLVERGSIDLWNSSRQSTFSAMAVADLNADRYPDFIALTSDSTLSRWISEPATNALEPDAASGDDQGCACSSKAPPRASGTVYAFALWLSAGWVLARRKR